MTFQTTITEVCSYIGDNWMIDPHPPQELLEGYFHLISKEYENQHFSMYGFIMNETLYIKGCVFNVTGSFKPSGLFPPALQK